MMSMNELMDAAKGVTNMFLAHEIAVDKDFHLEKLNKNNNVEDDASGGMEAQIKKIVHQAFWDVLASELAEEPPVFNQVCSLPLLAFSMRMMPSLIFAQAASRSQQLLWKFRCLKFVA